MKTTTSRDQFEMALRIEVEREARQIAAEKVKLNRQDAVIASHAANIQLIIGKATIVF